jgi:hypothetical protein
MTGDPSYVHELSGLSELLPNMLALALPLLDWDDAIQMAMSALDVKGKMFVRMILCSHHADCPPAVSSAIQTCMFGRSNDVSPPLLALQSTPFDHSRLGYLRFRNMLIPLAKRTFHFSDKW